MKKIFSLFLAFGMICAMGISTVGCSKGTDTAKKDTAKKDEKKDDKKP